MKAKLLLTLSALLLLVIAACGPAAPAAPAEPAEMVSTLDSVTESGTVRIGVRNDNPPMSFIDENGDWVGFDVEFANAIAEEMGFEAELVAVDGSTRISFIQEGRVDMSVASMNHTRSRDDAIDFSITYFWDNQSFLTRTGEYTEIEELFGKRVAVGTGSSTIESWTRYSEAAGAPAPIFVEFDDKLSAIQAVRDGAVEGYTEDNITMLALSKGDDSLELLPDGHNPVQFGVGVPINDSEWRDAVNYAMQETWKDGTHQALYERWFEGPDRIIDLPLGGAMEVWP